MPNRRRTVTFENGITRDDVPPGITTFEGYEKYKASRREMGVEDLTPFSREADPYSTGFERDVKRVYQSVVGRPAAFLESLVPLDALLDPTKTARERYGEDFYDLKIGDRMKRVQEATARKVSEDYSGESLINPNLEEFNDIFDKDGYVTATETSRGALLNFGSYVAGGVGVYRGLARLASKSPRAFKSFARKHNISATVADSIITGTAVDQWLTNPNEGSFLTALNDMGFNNSALSTIGEYLETDEDDTALEKRTKMLLGNLPFEAVFGGIVGAVGKDTSVFTTQSGKMASKLSSEEVAEEGINGLKRTKRELMQPTQTKLTVPAINDEGREVTEVWKVIDDLTENEQVFAQEGFFRGLYQKFTQSRGYNVYAGQDAFEQATQAKRKYQNKAEHIVGRLGSAVQDILTKNPNDEVLNNIFTALTSRKKKRLKAFRDLKGDELVQYLKSEFNLTDEIAGDVIEVRKLVDEMSTELNRFAPNPEIEKIIKNNLSSYMRKSYRLFENKDYQATEVSKRRAADFFFNEFKKEAELNNETIDVLALQNKANNKVDDILTDRTAGREVFERRKDLAAPVRELMGEITDPLDAILLTTSKMADYYQRARFLSDMKDIGTRQKWLFDSKPEGLEGLVKLNGKRFGPLENLYTTPKMAQVLDNREVSIMGEGKINNPLYKNFLSLKGFANKAATVFSWTTNVRNILGGMQFNLVNGLSFAPLGVFSENNFAKNFRTIANNAKLKGDEGLDALYEKYVGLGIINTNVRVGDFRALINEGLDASSIDDFMGRFSNKVSRGAENFYVGTDDFFKLNAFASELDTLKRANKGGKPVEVLEMEAADKVKNTMPNYDRVPPGIKALRNWPLGTFVSFPAEILRTSYGIAREAGKELLSGNRVLMTRGAMRVAGMYVGATGATELSSLTNDAYVGWSDKQKRAAEIMTETPWSKNSPRLWSKDEETGKIYSVDTKYLDAYNTIKEPILAVLNSVEEGKISEEDMPRKLYDGMTEGIKTLVTPFVSQAIFSKAVSDTWYASQNPEGETPDGKRLFAPESDIEDRIADSAYFILSSLVPGTVDSVDRLIRSYDEEKNPFTGDPKFDSDYEWTSLLTGMRFTEFNPEQQLNFAISKYRDSERDVRNIFASYGSSMGDLVDQYRNAEKQRYDLQQELYRYIQASQYFIDDTSIYNQLTERGISNDDAFELLKGKFVPQNISADLIKDIFEKTSGSPDSYAEIQDKFSRVYSDMSRTLLNTVEEED